MSGKRFLVFSTILCLSILLTGCGAIEKMQKANGTIFLVLDCICTVSLILKVMNTTNMNNRGTNTLTRFVRDGAANFLYSRLQGISFGCTLVFCFLGLTLGGGRFWVGLPTLAPLVLTMIYKKKSTENEQRVKDARVVTKGSLEATAATAEAVGETVGTAIGTYAGHGNDKIVKLGNTIGKAVGGVASSVADKAGAQMTDVEGIGITKEDMKPLNDVLTTMSRAAINLTDPTAFMEAAQRTGVAKQGEDVNQVAQRVYAMIPEAAKQQLADKTEGEQAMLFLEGKV